MRVLHEGSMSVVYECVSGSFGFPCAVKVLRADLCQEPEQHRRFQTEVRLTVDINHPNLPFASGADVLDTGAPFLAMQLLPGQTLRAALANDRALDPRVASNAILQVLEALRSLHEHEPSIVHCNVKPNHIFFHTPKYGPRAVKLLDLGAATPAHRSARNTGTLGYMAPEQLLDQPVTKGADLYATAVVLYEMLTGSLPFRSTDPAEVARDTLSATPPRLSASLPWVSRAVDDIVAAALEKNPESRPSAAAFAETLLDLQHADIETDATTAWSRST